MVSGSNFNDSSKEFTHAAVVRFRSCNHFLQIPNILPFLCSPLTQACLCHFLQLMPWRFSLRVESIKM